MSDGRPAMVDCARHLRDLHQLELTDDAVEGLVDYVDLLIRSNQKTNLVGTEDPSRLLDEMVFDSLQVLPLLPACFDFADIGSGGGLPGIPLATARPQSRGTLVEPRTKRAAFLRLACAELCLDNVRVVDGEIQAAPSRVFDVALAKAVFSPREWVERADRLLKPGGLIAVYANGTAAEAAALLDPAQQARVTGERSYAVAGGRARTVFVVAGTT
jgi:16S rRNA (guanine527-N7)-methyltransferase